MKLNTYSLQTFRTLFRVTPDIKPIKKKNCSYISTSVQKVPKFKTDEVVCSVCQK